MNLQDKTTFAAAKVIALVQQEHLSDTELGAIHHVLTLIESGGAQTLLDKKQREFSTLVASTKTYLEKNPKDYIIVVGDIRIPKSQVVGIARGYGIAPHHIRFHTDMGKLKNNFPFEEIGNKQAIGVFIGSVPHKVTGGNGSTSPVDAIETIKGSRLYRPPDLKITKESLKNLLYQFIQHIAAI